MNRSGSIVFNQALLSLATDSGLHPLVPYFTYFIADEVVLKILHTILICASEKNLWLVTQAYILSTFISGCTEFE